jgi:hypothetical protein
VKRCPEAIVPALALAYRVRYKPSACFTLASDPNCQLGVSVASLRLAYSETPKRNALRCARLAMMRFVSALRHASRESWQGFLIFVRRENFINDDGG